jgi:PAS domain S-box-containing protein
VRTKIFIALLATVVAALCGWLIWGSANATSLQPFVLIGLVCASVALGVLLRQLFQGTDRGRVPANWLDQLPHPVVVKDSEGKYVYLNRAFEKLAVVQADAMLGEQAASLYQTHSAKIEEQDRQALTDLGVPKRIELTQPTPTGVRKDVFIDKVGIQLDDGKLAVLASVMDVTELRRVERELADEKNRLNLVIKASQQGVFDLLFTTTQGSQNQRDAAPNYLSVIALRMFGLSATPSNFRDVFAYVAPEDRGQLEHEIQLFVASNQESIVTEFQVNKSPDVRTWLRLQGTAVRANDGATDGASGVRFVGSVVDVTAVKQAELALLSQKKFVSDIVEMSPSAIFLKDADGIWRMVNQAWEKISAQDRGNVIGRRSRDFQRAEVADQNESQDRELIASPEGYSQRRIIFHNRLGTFYDAVITKRVIREPSGKVWGIIGTIVDLTERFKLERQVSNQRELLDMVIQSAKFGVWDHDIAGDSYFVSPRYKQMLGYPVEMDMPLQGLEALAHPEDKQIIAHAMQSLVPGDNDLFDVEFRALQHSGEPLWVEARAKAVFDEAGKVKRIVGSIHDIATRKLRESQLEQANKEALQAVTAKAAFLSTMSHEIRTPLNGVIGAASLLDSTPLDTEQRRFVETINVSAEALLAVISDVLDFSKIDSGRMSLEYGEVNIVDLVEQVIDIVADKARAKQVEVFYDIASDVAPTAMLDPVRVRQVLLNIVGNAVKFTDKGHVCIAVRRSADTPVASAESPLVFEVIDTGIGIPAEDMHRIFEAFAQADSSTTRRFGGTGLGLAIAQKLTQIMGGAVVVSSEVGKGSRFTVSIPLQAARAPVTTSDTPSAVTPINFSPSASVVGLEVGRSLDVHAAQLHGVEVAVLVGYPGLAQAVGRMISAWGLVPVVFGSVGEMADAAGEGKRWGAILLDFELPADHVNRCLTLVPGKYVIGLSQRPSTSLPNELEHAALMINTLLLKPVRQSQLFNAVLSVSNSGVISTTFDRSMGSNTALLKALPQAKSQQKDTLSLTQTITPLRLERAADPRLVTASHGITRATSVKLLQGLQVLVAEDNSSFKK